ncbi:monovalent cation/H+ antiporter subunit D [Porphyrobacter sp. GA68]|uniref:monovalent cation/H+ antiporter subunit D n=1 Tax=Porphyrobacter sp. GA68 TaxID=2883480 RepID=UPI001D181EB5|nr:monovalent cation/H+ antiporter subunit D [Porphyrobacter sp. GA68]
MNHWLVAPVMLPPVVAALLLFGMHRSLRLGRAVALGSCLSLLVIAVSLLVEADGGIIQTYQMGDWAAPFGIVLVLDRLSALMLVLTAALATLVLVHVIATDLDRQGWHFHPMFQFQLLGLNGAFLTGDLFNLFVFFEVLLIASYGLMLHGQGAARLRAGVHYVVANLVGSTLFLVGVGLLYGVTGTLNFADMAVRVGALPPGDQGLARAGGLLLLVVFGLKAALLPLHLWLPQTYSATSAPVAALFAIMTKVGVYAIIRVFTLVFGAQAGALAFFAQPWLLPAALLTVVVGFIGLFAARSLRELAAYGVIGSTGTLLTAIALFEPAALAAGLYYLPHTTLAGATLFLLADLVARRRGSQQDRLVQGPRFPWTEPLSAFFLLAAVAVAGLPPLSGFVGKLLILSSAQAHPAAGWIWAAILGTTVLVVLGFARAGSLLFWKSAAVGEPLRPAPAQHSRAEFLALAALFGLLVALAALALPVTRYMEATAEQVLAPQPTIDAILTDRRGGA